MSSIVDTPFWIFLAAVPTMVLFCLAYLYSLHRPARHALLFAMPLRTLVRQPVSNFLRNSRFMVSHDVAPEHLDGRIDLARFSRDEIAPCPVVKGDMWVRGGKRVSDIAISIALIVFTLPLMLAVAALIKATSRGPVLYRQTRVGLNGRHFSIIKFRSMTVDAERNGAQWAGQNDARVTAIGRIIRKTRIDEIPQAFNILKGDMSFVGPRPERPAFTQMLAEELPHYDERHRVKPGLTGWAQINYQYGASVDDAREKLRYDLYYLKNHSLLLDLFIILRTISVALRGEGGR